MTRPDRAVFFVERAVAPGAQVSLSEGDAQHISVLRLGAGERVGLRDGAGQTASGTLVRMGRKNALVEVDEIDEVPAPSPIHLLVPVADRDRMLWLAEKAAELNVASWRPEAAGIVAQVAKCVPARRRTHVPEQGSQSYDRRAAAVAICMAS